MQLPVDSTLGNIFGDNIGEEYIMGAKKNENIHGYHNMVYYLDINAKICDDTQTSINQMISELQRVFDSIKAQQ